MIDNSMRGWLAAIGCGALLLVGACSDDDDSTGDRTVADAGQDDASDDSDDPDSTDSGGDGSGPEGAIPPEDAIPEFGEDPDFDALAEDCFDGDLAACDELFSTSELGSGYEAYGGSCGERLESAQVGDTFVLPGNCEEDLPGAG